MGTVRKIGEEYYIEFFARGLLYQQKAGKNQEAAETLLNEIEGKIRDGEIGITVRDVDIDVFLKTFLERTRPGHTSRTHARYEAVVKHFETFCGAVLSKNSKLSDVTPGMMEEYRAFLLKGGGIKTGQPVNPNVINFTLYLLRDILDFAIKLGFLNDNPMLHVRLLKVPQHKKPLVLDRKSVQTLLERASDDLKVIIKIILGTGLHVDELIELKWTGVDFQNKCLKIERCLGAGHDRCNVRFVPMDIMVIQIMRDLREKSKSYEEYVFCNAQGRPLKKDRFVKDFARLVEKSGLDGAVNLRCLRDTFARDVLHTGVSLIGLSKLLGLSDMARVMRYEGFVGENKNRSGGYTDLSEF